MDHNTSLHLPFSNPVIVFTLVLFFILVVPILLKRLKTPGIVGLILSGVLIGPHGLNLIEKSSAIDLLSTIGLLYIMFLAGLELNLHEFIKQKNRSFTFGLLTFIIPISIGLPVCFYLLGLGFMTSLLTSIMFATHTLIAYPIVSRMGLTSNEAVAITVGGTILSDTAVLIILSIISTGYSSSFDQWYVLKTSAGILLFLLFIFMVIPWLSRWFFKAHQGDHGAHFIFVLFIVFLLSLMAEMASVEPIIGAFAAGLVLNPFIPHHSTLSNRISFTGNALFIPFFLISVGMLVDPRILFSNFKAIEIAIVLTLVAFSGKYIAAFFTQKLFRYSRDQRHLIFGLSSAHAAATLAIILVGFNLGILDENILNGTIILILVTSLIATLVTERAAIHIAVAEKTIQLSGEAILEKVIVPVAKPENLEKLIELAIQLKEKDSLTPITILTVVKDDQNSNIHILNNQKRLKPLIEYAASMNVALDLTTSIDVNAATGIIRLSRETMANLMVLGWKGKPNFTQHIFGHFYERLIHTFDGQIVIARLTQPLNLHQSLQVLVPPLFTRELGFSAALNKLIQLSKGLKLKTILSGNKTDLSEIQNHLKTQKMNWNATYIDSPSPEHYIYNRFDQNKTTLVLAFTSREHAPSYHPYLANLPKHFDEIGFEGSFIMYYPAQNPMLSLKEIK
ncbi:MAG: cation:proton antiporter [Prolixibacteraceae bacterium]